MRFVATLSALTLVSMAARARAGDEGFRLSWNAPDGCPSADDVRSATLQGTAPRMAIRGDVLEAEARVEHREIRGTPGWKVHLRTRRGETTGEREIEAATCNGVAEATAVVLALALAPEESFRGDEPAAAAPVPLEKSAPRARLMTDRRRTLAIGASITGDASTLPSATLGGSLSLAWVHGRARLELDARRWASQSQTLSASDAGARFSMTSIGGRGCWAALQRAALELAPCAGADVNLVSAPGYGADANYSPTEEWTVITGGALGRWSLGSWLALRARGEAFVPLSRPTFVVQGEGIVHRPPAIGAAASLGVELLFL